MQKKAFKRQKRSIRNIFSGLDYTTALIVACLALFIFSIGIVASNYIKEEYYNKIDHKKPLVITNLTYCNGEKLDLTVPQSSNPVPLVIYIHGGGWQYGSKVGGSVNLVKPLISQGFAVASINYRLSHAAKFPAQVQDVFCAVRYLRAYADRYQINPDQIGLIGISAGAHLAVLAANTADNQEFTKGSYPEQSNKVGAAVAINGVYNLTADNITDVTNQNINRLLSGSSSTRSQASPVSYVTSNLPPQLLIYSIKDAQVSPKQTKGYYTALQKEGGRATILPVDSADHNLGPYWSLDTNPKRKQIFNTITEFFKKELQK